MIFEDEIYRASGGEFVVLAEQVTPVELEDKFTYLREIAKEVQLAISTSMVYCENSTYIDTKMKEADEATYQDKRKYYLMHERCQPRHHY